MKKIFLFSAVILVISSLLCCNTDPEEVAFNTRLKYSVTVFEIINNGSDSLAIDSVRVKLTTSSLDTIIGYTDADGFFEFDPVSSHNNNFTLTKDGFKLLRFPDDFQVIDSTQTMKFIDLEKVMYRDVTVQADTTTIE